MSRKKKVPAESSERIVPGLVISSPPRRIFPAANTSENKKKTTYHPRKGWIKEGDK